jgi:hypothetical protein
MRHNYIKLFILVLCLAYSPASIQDARAYDGAEIVSSHGYDGCIRLFNDSMSVILDPNLNGRVLEYSLNGVNVMYIDPSLDGKTYTPGGESFIVTAGRFDFGPERTGPDRTKFYFGSWTAEITGPRSARLTSVRDEEITGVQLTRDFTLAEEGSRLDCTQTIINISDEMRHYYYWSRTLAVGGGVTVVPLSEGSRFPKGYVYYEPAQSPKFLNFRPDEHDGMKLVRDEYLTIAKTPPFPKFVFDSTAGWLGYITRDNHLFLKTYETFPERAYGDLTPATASIWQVENRTEIEPIGPSEFIPAGGQASFTVSWWLFPYEYPGDSGDIDFQRLSGFVRDNAGK